MVPESVVAGEAAKTVLMVECDLLSVLSVGSFRMFRIKSIDDLRVIGNPVSSVVAFTSNPDAENPLNIFMVSQSMKKKGWNLSTLQHPSAYVLYFTTIWCGLFKGAGRVSPKHSCLSPEISQ